MEALQKVFDAIKAILGYFETFAAEIMASLGLDQKDDEAAA